MDELVQHMTKKHPYEGAVNMLAFMALVTWLVLFIPLTAWVWKAVF